MNMKNGCDLLSNYTECIKPISKECINLKLKKEHDDLKDLLSVQMYICELLVPSVNEHKSCFAIKRKDQCATLA